MRSKFELIFENYSGKFTKGGFLPGDFVTFKDGALSNTAIKSGSEDYKAKIKELIDSDAHLRISSLTSVAATNSAEPDSTADKYNATIYQTNPGNSAVSTDNVVTVPLEVLDKVARTSDEAQMKVPDSFKRAADKRVSHTNQNKASAELEDDSYDKGKDWKGGKRSGETGNTGKSLKKDSDASGVKKESTIVEENQDHYFGCEYCGNKQLDFNNGICEECDKEAITPMAIKEPEWSDDDEKSLRSRGFYEGKNYFQSHMDYFCDFLLGEKLPENVYIYTKNDEGLPGGHPIISPETRIHLEDIEDIVKEILYGREVVAFSITGEPRESIQKLNDKLSKKELSEDEELDTEY